MADDRMVVLFLFDVLYFHLYFYILRYPVSPSIAIHFSTPHCSKAVAANNCKSKLVRYLTLL